MFATAAVIRCPRCQRPLGEWVGDHVLIRHEKREIAAREIVFIRCDRRPGWRGGRNHGWRGDGLEV